MPPAALVSTPTARAAASPTRPGTPATTGWSRCSPRPDPQRYWTVRDTGAAGWMPDLPSTVGEFTAWADGSVWTVLGTGSGPAGRHRLTGPAGSAVVEPESEVLAGQAEGPWCPSAGGGSLWTDIRVQVMVVERLTSQDLSMV